jgi:hypothetical protein
MSEMELVAWREWGWKSPALWYLDSKWEERIVMGDVTLEVLKGWDKSLGGACKNEIKAAEKALRDWGTAADESDNAELGFGLSVGGSILAVLTIVACSGPQAALCLGFGAGALGASLGNQFVQGKGRDLARKGKENARDDYSDVLDDLMRCVKKNTAPP